MFNLLLGNTGRVSPCQLICSLTLSLSLSRAVQLGALFKQYAVQYPKLGLTEQEFRSFLRKECQVRIFTTLLNERTGGSQVEECFDNSCCGGGGEDLFVGELIWSTFFVDI